MHKPSKINVILILIFLLSVAVFAEKTAGEEKNSSNGYEYDLSPEEEPEEYSGENRYRLLVPPSYSPAWDPVDKDAGVKTNIATMIDIIEQMGFAEKAAAARQLLRDKKITAGDISKNGYCNSVFGTITLNNKDVPKNDVKAASSYSHIRNPENQRRMRNNDIVQIFVYSATLYHELVHCLQQSFDGSGTAYWLSVGEYSHEVEAHRKDILFTIDLIRNLDRIYSRIFQNEQLAAVLRANIIKELVGSLNYSYGFFRRYQKKLPDGVTKEMIDEGYEFIHVPEDLNIMADLEDLEREINTTINNLPAVETEEDTRNITEIDQKLGLIRPQGDHFVFVSVGWLTDLAGVYNVMKKSAFKDFIGNNIGKRTNFNFIYEDGKKVTAGLEVKNGKIVNILNDEFSNPTVDIHIQRLAMAGFLNGPNFYQAVLDAYQSNQIQANYHTASEKRKKSAYFKKVFPSKKKSIAKTKTGKILPKDIMFPRETLILATQPANKTVPPITTPPVTIPPTTIAPTTVAPTTVPPTTISPTTVAPSTVKPVCNETNDNVAGSSMPYLTVTLNEQTYKFAQFSCANEFNYYKVAWCGKVESIPMEKITDGNYVVERFYESPEQCPPCEQGMKAAGCQETTGESGAKHGSCVCLSALD